VNASDYSGGPFAPNSVVSLFGTNLSYSAQPVAVSQTSMNGAMLPTELADVHVLVDGQPAPLLFVSAAQINFLVSSTEIPGNINVQVVRQSIAGPAVSITLVDAAPALFASNGYALAQDYNNQYAVISPTAPAHSGDTIVLYATGLGHTQPNPLPGEVPATAATVVASPVVLLNGSAIDGSLIKYAGVTPSCAGLYQINFVLPGGLNSDAEIRVSAGGQTSAAGLKLAIH
jgi:uncharacterized protein (TIGR03437 family)